MQLKLSSAVSRTWGLCIFPSAPSSTSSSFFSLLFFILWFRGGGGCSMHACSLQMCLHAPFVRGLQRGCWVSSMTLHLVSLSLLLHLELTFQLVWWPEHHSSDPFVLVPLLTLCLTLQFLQRCIVFPLALTGAFFPSVMGIHSANDLGISRLIEVWFSLDT